MANERTTSPTQVATGRSDVLRNFARDVQTNEDTFAAAVNTDPAADQPASGTLRLAEDGAVDVNIRGRNGAVEADMIYISAGGNLVVGRIGGPAVFVDSAGAIQLRAINAAAVATLNASRFDMPVPVGLPVYAVGEEPTGAAGDVAFFSDGDAGSPCLGVHDGTSWKRVALGATVAAT